MSFLIQRVKGGALTLAEVAGDVLRIGRGTRAALRSDNPAVSLDHATIALDAAGYTITDLGSITGTYVNGRPVETARLAKGDVVEIGDLRMEVQSAEPARPLFLRIASTTPAGQAEEVEEESAAPATAPRGGAVAAPQKVDYVGAYRLRRPYLTKLSVMALLLIAGFVVLAEVTSDPQKQVVFMPGGVSSAHARAAGGEVAKNCQACHDPFRGVTDAKCIACHTQPPHAPTQTGTPQCLSCHAEHRGAVKLAMIADAKCTACHGDLAAHDTRPVAPELAHVTAFDDHHPDLVKPADPDTLKFNHKLHLQPRGIFNASGKREVLQCTMCHKLAADRNGKLDPKPVSFAGDCQRCHRLTFDARFPNEEVPHGGEPGIVYGFVGLVYSGERNLAGKSPEELRRILTARTSMSASESTLVSAEQVIKAKCAYCHTIERSEGRLVATRPVLRTRWIQHSRFTHTEHRACEACHAMARQSVNTADVLLPDKKDCTGCHAPRDGKVGSTCVTCHEYHEGSKGSLTKAAAAIVTPGRPRRASLLGGDAPGMMGWIFLAAIVVLLVIVFIPVAIALMRRVSRKEPPPPAAPRAARPVPPPIQPPLDLRTDKVPSVTAPQQPAAPAPPQRPASSTAPAFFAEAKQGTEMVQWYGMLVCTSGPLEGKRFVVEEDGFYIGRDPTLAQVVIADSRISKRHVRIAVHDGKVHAVDQDSTNGTFLGKAGGERITDVQLRKGDVIVLADNAASFTYQI